MIVVIILLLLLFLPLCPSEFTTGGSRGRPHSYHGGILRQDKTKDLKAYPRSRTEQCAVEILEKITKKRFPSVNPAWLMYQGKTLELDAYNEEEGLAMEVQGPLHTKFYPKIES